MIFSRPPQFEQRSVSISNARLSSLAQLSRTGLMLDVASGRKQTWAEHWKLHNALVLFNPAPVT